MDYRIMAKWALSSIDIQGGFLAGFSSTLPVGLTCIIGPRGSGKSTLAEAIRFGLCGLVGASKKRTDLVQANLGQATIVIRTVASPPNLGYIIRRAHRQTPSLTAADGTTISNVDLDRGSFLPLDGYSSDDVEAIADESLGEK